MKYNSLMTKLLIGYILKPHGLKGQLKIRINNPLFLDYVSNIIDNKGKNFNFISIKLHNKLNNIYIGTIKNINNINDTNIYINNILYIDKSLINLKKEEYFYDDLLGLDVYMINENTAIGKIISVDNFGSEDLLEIEMTVGQKVFIPFNSNVCSIENNKIILNKESLHYL